MNRKIVLRSIRRFKYGMEEQFCTVFYDIVITIGMVWCAFLFATN